ncbi:hypothetical protein [Enhygromyxa salina]|uniref:hypothetical protein n=1 Tax=Enhygromyxa salina TaxID=215803 RepID=UPI0011B28F7C|nr:hypothetical protein [Enhygromyxa salina]
MATSDEHGVEVIAYDHKGDVVATVVALPRADGPTTFAVDFDDGYLDIVRDTDGIIGVETSLSPGLVETRMSVIDAALGDAMADLDGPNNPQEGKFTCAAGAIGSVLSCASLRLWCPVAILATMCSCLDAAGHEEACP